MAINTLYRYFMDKIEIKTLIDITNTKVARPTQGNQLEQDQYRNFVTLLQCLELRSVIGYDHNPAVELVDIANLEFGSEYTGKQMVWTFYVIPDREGVYTDNKNNEIGLLIDDCHLVPVIKNLKETVNIDKAVFNTKDSRYKNILIKAL